MEAGRSYLDRDRSADHAVSGRFRQLVARRVGGEPMAYVIGEAGFRHLTLTVDRRALIPRPESEGLVDLALERVRTGRAADLGTGSGCLALALRQEGGFEVVVALDRSRDALALAGENRARTGLAIALVHADFGSAVRPGSLDLIVSNPPYLTDAEHEALDPSVAAWEPREALTSGPAGMTATERIFAEGPALLRSGGWLVMELDSTRARLAAEAARGFGWHEVDVTNDLFGRPRYLTARRGTR